MKDKNILSAIILCGGMSRRMGEDKGLMEIDKKPMIIHVLETLTHQIDEVIIVLNDNERIIRYKPIIQKYLNHNLNFDFDIKFVEDEIKNKGPLSGIMTGLKIISSDYALVLPCDSPYISSEFVSYMFNILSDFLESDDTIEGIIPYHSLENDNLKKVILNNSEPLHSIYKKNNYLLIYNLLNNNEKQVKSFINQINAKFIPIDNDKSNNKINEINFKNINYRNDL